METTCKNCDLDFTSECMYCPNCGQKVALHRLTMHDLVHEGIHYFTHADKGIFQLIKALTVKRGVVAREYIDGRRRKYFPPLNFYLIIAAVFVFMSTLDKSYIVVDVEKAHPELQKIADPEQRQLALDLWKRRHNVDSFTKQYSNIMALFALPLTAAIFWLFYRKAKYNYVEHLVAGMYMLGYCLLLYAVLILSAEFILNINHLYAVSLFFVLQLVYFTVFYCGFIDGHSKLAILKAFATSLTALIVWSVLTTTLIILYIQDGFWGLME